MGDNEPDHHSPIRVLYVDDDPSFLEIVKLILEQNPAFLIDTTPSCIEALQMLSQGTYDLVLSDFRMNNMDGGEFLKKTRSLDPDIPFIFFTGRDRREMAIVDPVASSALFFEKGGDPAVQYAALQRCIMDRVLSHRAAREQRSSGTCPE